LEAAVTRRFLEAVPFEQLDFQPHEKSEKLGRLAVHVAEIMAWFSSCIRDKQLDFEHFVPNTFDNKDALLSYFDGLLKEASELLLSASDAVFEEVWSMTYGEEVLFALPKKTSDAYLLHEPFGAPPSAIRSLPPLAQCACSCHLWSFCR
jgi:hypothetical protein